MKYRGLKTNVESSRRKGLGAHEMPMASKYGVDLKRKCRGVENRRGPETCRGI